MKIRFACVAILVLAAGAFGQAAKPGTVGYRGKTYEPAQLPAEIGSAAKTAVNTWAPWAKAHGYRLDLDPSRRILLVSTKGNVDAALGLLVKTIALFDALFPALMPETPGVISGGIPASAPKAGAVPPEDVIPEDPETPPPGAPETLPPEREETTTIERKVFTFRPDSQTAVILVAKNTDDYGAALEMLAKAHVYLANWKAEALKHIGFSLQEPLCGAYNENSPGQEEWSPDNELVHRAMALLVLRRFSWQPYWLHTGLCWYAEMGVMKNIYCMPYRDGFVGIGEHGGWIEDLNSIYSGRAKEPLRMEELALKRGKWDDKLAKSALGMVDFLSKVNPRALSGLMEELRRYADQHGRVTSADGTWTKVVDYEVPGEQQKILLERYYGVNVMRDAIAHWTGGAPAPVK